MFPNRTASDERSAMPKRNCQTEEVCNVTLLCQKKFNFSLFSRNKNDYIHAYKRFAVSCDLCTIIVDETAKKVYFIHVKCPSNQPSIEKQMWMINGDDGYDDGN